MTDGSIGDVSWSGTGSGAGSEIGVGDDIDERREVVGEGREEEVSVGR